MQAFGWPRNGRFILSREFSSLPPGNRGTAGGYSAQPARTGGSATQQRQVLGNTIHKKQVPYWEPPKWVFLGGTLARPVPVAAAGPTAQYFIKFLLASPSSSSLEIEKVSGGGFKRHIWNWAKISCAGAVLSIVGYAAVLSI